MMKTFLPLLLSLSVPAMTSALNETMCNQVFYNPTVNFFDILTFSNYDQILREDSTITLAQAGTYTGPKEFQEYVSFATFLAPYVASGPNIMAAENHFIEYNQETDTCEYLLPLFADYLLDDNFASYNASFHVSYMIKYQFSYSEQYLKDSFVYYTTEYLNWYFGDVLNNDKMAHYICSELSGSCNNTMDGEPLESCMAAFADLPATQGEDAHFDGNSKGCRDVHVVLAGFAPEVHCPHVALTPTPDITGSIKCQESKYLDPTDMFTPQDMEILHQFQLAVGVKPETGFDIMNDVEGDVTMEQEVEDAAINVDANVDNATATDTLTSAPAEVVSKEGVEEQADKVAPTSSAFGIRNTLGVIVVAALAAFM